MKRSFRLDTLLHQRGLAPSREKAKRLIQAGQVHVDGRLVDKVAWPVAGDVEISIREGLPYVSRGGYKLAHALDAFEISPKALVVADVGASTGGFTDCLLQRGAERVYAIDVGYGQLDWTLRTDPRVVVLERTNARHLEALPEPVALATIDVSFISLRLILPRVWNWLSSDGQVVALVKPQFEAGREQVGKGGVVRDRRVHQRVLADILGWATSNGWHRRGLARSPITGPKGNIEFLLWLGTDGPESGLAASEAIAQALRGSS